MKKSTIEQQSKQFGRAASDAIAAFQQGDPEPLRRLAGALLERDPSNCFACTNLGLMHARKGDFDQAITLYRQGLAAHPDDPTLHSNIARALCESRHWQAAYHHAHRAVELAPDNVVGLLNLTWACTMTDRFSEGEAAVRRAINLQPDDPLLWNNLGSLLKEQGRVHEAVTAFRQAVQLDPGYEYCYLNLLLTLQYDVSATVADIVDSARVYAAQFEQPHIPFWPLHDNLPVPWRRLHIGFISPDFNDHSVMYFVEPLLARLDRNQYKLFCYYTYPAGSDDVVTRRVQRYADHFVHLGGKQPDEQARIIQNDRIDILIDLAGHTAKSGLPGIMHKPAPVQVTWLGYPGTTGLTAIDWRITDTVADKDVEELKGEGLQEELLQGIPPLKEQYAEKLAFLPPPFCVYRPCIRNPLNRYMPQYQVRPTPAVTNGFITFGCCNNLAKLTPNVLTAWSKLLQQLPTARLLIEGKGFDNDEVVNAFREKCANHGIDPDRLDLIPRDPQKQYLTYHQIDIALDPFPLTGGTTTFDVLWMGLPLVTMRGTSFRSRMGMSFLAAAGLTEWIARDEDEYIELAVRLATDIPALNARRLQQRQRVETSPLMDEPRFAYLFSETLRQAWLKWCASKVAPDNPQGQFQQWLQDKPQTQQVEPQVFQALGERVSLTEARKRLGETFAAVTDESGWQEVIGLARLMLESIPKEPVALAALAEAEYAHGNLQAAIAYLSHAVDAAAQNIPFYHRLIHWHREAGNKQAAETIIRLMQQRGVQANTLA